MHSPNMINDGTFQLFCLYSNKTFLDMYCIIQGFYLLLTDLQTLVKVTYSNHGEQLGTGLPEIKPPTLQLLNDPHWVQQPANDRRFFILCSLLILDRAVLFLSLLPNIALIFNIFFRYSVCRLPLFYFVSCFCTLAQLRFDMHTIHLSYI